MNYSDVENLKARFNAVNQGHVFHYFDELDEGAQAHLVTQAASIDLEELEQLIAKHLPTEPQPTNPQALFPAPCIHLPENGGT